MDRRSHHETKDYARSSINVSVHFLGSVCHARAYSVPCDRQTEHSYHLSGRCGLKKNQCESFGFGGSLDTVRVVDEGTPLAGVKFDLAFLNVGIYI